MLKTAVAAALIASFGLLSVPMVSASDHAAHVPAPDCALYCFTQSKTSENRSLSAVPRLAAAAHLPSSAPTAVRRTKRRVPRSDPPERNDEKRLLSVQKKE